METGVDEVGRGAIFGVVVAGAVTIPDHQFDYLKSMGVKDSKKLSPNQRAKLDRVIRAVADCGIGLATVAEIEELNILNASLLAMERAIAQLNTFPAHCFIDGNQRLKFQEIPMIPHTTVIKGDSIYLSIAAASIIAKVWRDRLITELAQEYPKYDLARNKGYATQRHRDALSIYGITNLHRQSFCTNFLAAK
ncbi:ribonuclease HII [Synechococcus sp. PCC 7502]|uniref:ribonuclease HII n=1 Tax=Synechococcus sp. PCC 7502 TaxID=1173263 RepID=UPI00029FAA11|nr:ribonuclease HII [Synechococcus sp. PCC 7502]AFY72651.1 ribonuclease HII [Synechococcus sp. PCC 7502]